MKQIGNTFLFSLLSISVFAQGGAKTGNEKNSLLWKITGNGLEKPSYLYGTIHMLCADDAVFSDSLKNVISRCDEVYLEVNINDIMEMMGVMGQMKMRDDTTLTDLLSEEEYKKVKKYFDEKSPLLPFSVLETFKPILAASTLAGSSFDCESTVMMEQLIVEEAEKNDKKVKGLESMAYQAGILDSIPYKLQAMELVKYIENIDKAKGEDTELNDLMEAYKQQNLEKMEELMMKSDAGINSYTELLLYKRNRNWVKKLKTLMPAKSLVIAVGAGHLPGEQGVINLLRKEGFTVTPVENKITKIKSI